MVYLIVSMIVWMYSNIGKYRNLCGIHVESIWNSLFHVELDGIQVEQQWNLYHNSRWIPEHHSIWNGGIHVESIAFHVEYRWNGITKMAGISPKTYSMWNGWNPPGMMWIPYGFPVECGGRVKTSLHGTPCRPTVQLCSRVALMVSI